MTASLLHLVTPAEWRAALATGAVAPPSLLDVGFVHLSTADQVALPADRMFRGRGDLLLLVLDPARIGVEVRFEEGDPPHPDGMPFPHAYGPVPTSAVLAVLPYRPRDDGGFDAPVLPTTDPAGRQAGFAPSVLRRVATTEVRVTGGVGVVTAPYPVSWRHNGLLIDAAASAAQVAADADRVLGGHGLAHRSATLSGSHLADTAAGLAELGWRVQHVIGMAAPAGGSGNPRVERVDLDTLRPVLVARFHRDEPAVPPAGTNRLVDRHVADEQAVDLRYLAVRDGGAVVASCLLMLDGGTALLDVVHTDPAARGRGHGDALVVESLALAGREGCDLVVLDALATDWPRHWYARRGFVEVAESWSAVLPG